MEAITEYWIGFLVLDGSLLLDVYFLYAAAAVAKSPSPIFYIMMCIWASLAVQW